MVKGALYEAALLGAKALGPVSGPRPRARNYPMQRSLITKKPSRHRIRLRLSYGPLRTKQPVVAVNLRTNREGSAQQRGPHA